MNQRGRRSAFLVTQREVFTVTPHAKPVSYGPLSLHASPYPFVMEIDYDDASTTRWADTALF
ncbi:Hypothetical protein Y17_0251 [Pectobacterium wasabiae CFBP 3304]|nr:Hypothetical protein Y17_0251 [Pectobacterium wasabiae CFBP 3304]